jgi:hypothetical protein
MYGFVFSIVVFLSFTFSSYPFNLSKIQKGLEERERKDRSWVTRDRK